MYTRAGAGPAACYGLVFDTTSVKAVAGLFQNQRPVWRVAYYQGNGAWFRVGRNPLNNTTTSLIHDIICVQSPESATPLCALAWNRT